MEIIAHRVNTTSELEKVPREYGVEIDLRDRGDRIVLTHDPFTDGEDFESYLRRYAHGTLILNIKSERIEHRVLEMVRKSPAIRYFLLDSSFPMIHLLSEQGERNIAVRFSEYESIETILNMAGKIDWVWVDCFTRLPIDTRTWRILTDAGFRLCLVSPELQNRPGDIGPYRAYLADQSITFDAVCTKLTNAEKWITPRT
ncbi:MAG TPA: hypothetical protein PKM65_00655 [Spirochaetota bacterium]|nr:hypothetical protein [Spirochaetota bacterium]HNT11672.1 hypothetical protein [Spirochaetota bacterium]